MKTEKNNNKSRFRLPMSALVTYLLLACLLTTGVTFAKFISTSGGGDNARVAKFDVSTDDGGVTELVIDCNHAYSSTANYEFDVINNGETAIGYTVIVDMPSEFQQTVTLELNGQPPTSVTLTGHTYTFESDDVVPPNTTKKVTLSFVGDTIFNYIEESVNGINVRMIARQVD